MIQTILAVDNEDSILGEFFTECLKDIENYENEAKSLNVIKSNALNELAISLKLSELSKFIFLAFSHGSKESLLSNGSSPYISININNGIFLNAFFYACACNVGEVLGRNLVENGCSSFIGYNKNFEIWDFNRNPFVQCATYGYKLFLSGCNIETIIEKMKEKYDEYIDNYENDIFGAMMLLSNKNSLVYHGNSKHSISMLD